jgi:predicted small secreted protein
MMLKKTMNVLLISGAVVSLVACNTIRGAGEDVQSAANAVDNKT